MMPICPCCDEPVHNGHPAHPCCEAWQQRAPGRPCIACAESRRLNRIAAKRGH